MGRSSSIEKKQLLQEVTPEVVVDEQPEPVAKPKKKAKAKKKSRVKKQPLQEIYGDDL